MRRRLMMCRPTDYVTDGLVLHLDALDGYDPSQRKWISLVGEYSYNVPSGVIFGDKGVDLNLYYSDEYYLKGNPSNVSATPFRYEYCTIEAVFAPHHFLGYPASSVIWTPAQKYSRTQGGEARVMLSFNQEQVNFHTNGGGGGNTPYNGNLKGWATPIERGRPYRVSAAPANGIVLVNEKRVTARTSYNTTWGATAHAIGARYTSNSGFFSGRIYAIRIYNRLLSEAEMRHNQAVDFRRFDFSGIEEWGQDQEEE